MTFPVSAQTGASYVSANGLSGTYIPEVWSGKLLMKFYKATVFAAISNTDYEGEITSYGDKVIIRTIPDGTIRDYEVGLNLTYERLRSANVELLIDKGKYFAHPINDVERKQSDINYLNAWAKEYAQKLKIAIDVGILADVYADVSSSNAGSTAGAISGDVDLGATGTTGENALALTKNNIIDKITEAGLILDEQNIPEDDRWFVLPAWACQRIKVSELKDASLTGESKSRLLNGRVGMIDRFTIYSSNSVATTTETSTTCYNAMFGHKSALTFASQLVENETIDNPTDFGKLVRGLQVYGYKMILPEAAGHFYIKKG